ncbi:hypothetical protein ACIRQY_31990 [Streptomyces sp. NPDC101490]|uniref:hypothetical protein n=1 Tax=Streptomyces sp. NPDC101490 TaxID=3366143 RepID=UPI0037FB0627
MPETAPPTGPEDWDTALAGAFEILLGGQPPAAPATGYGVYYASDSLDEFLFPNSWMTVGTLAGREPTTLPDPDGPYPFSPWAWRFDLGGSLFRFDADLLAGTGAWGADGHKGPRPFDESFATALRTTHPSDEDGGVLVRGTDLGLLLARHGADLTGEDSEPLNTWLTVLLRVATDGTLTDAMRAATFTGRGPAHLVSTDDIRYADRAAEPWEERLGAVAHPALRDHLRMLCLTREHARSEGGFYRAAEGWPWPTEALKTVGCSLVAGWGFGESQAGAVVVRLPEG